MYWAELGQTNALPDLYDPERHCCNKANYLYREGNYANG